MKNILLFCFLAISILSVDAKNQPSDSKATPETIKLYQKMLKLQAKGLMFGHQDDFAYGTSWYAQNSHSDVKETCGDYPAAIGWELGHLELGNAYSLDSVYFDRIKSGIIKAYEMGAINTVSWHHRNPLTGGTAWDVTSKKTVSSILPGGEKHGLYTGYLDKLADFMLSLKTDKSTLVPLFFRPYHEHTGSWFWWGKNLCTVEEYKALWRFTVTYLRETKNVHNLLYAYSPDRFQTEQEYLERYPGDDLIDMVAFDLYDRGPDYPKVLGNCAKIVSQIAENKDKIGAVSEAGGPIAENTSWWTKTLLDALRPYNLSYVLVWRNPFLKAKDMPFGPSKGCPSENDFILFYKDPKTLFLKDIN